CSGVSAARPGGEDVAQTSAATEDRKKSGHLAGDVAAAPADYAAEDRGWRAGGVTGRRCARPCCGGYTAGPAGEPRQATGDGNAGYALELVRSRCSRGRRLCGWCSAGDGASE